MFKRISALATAAASIYIIGFAVPALAASPATTPTNDASKQAACESIGGTYSSGACSTDSSGRSLNSLIAQVVNIFSWFVGVVAVIFVIYGGFRYITAGGDAGKITGAKNTIVYALIGLVVAALAQIIVQYVLNKVSP